MFGALCQPSGDDTWYWCGCPRKIDCEDVERHGFLQLCGTPKLLEAHHDWCFNASNWLARDCLKRQSQSWKYLTLLLSMVQSQPRLNRAGTMCVQEATLFLLHACIHSFIDRTRETPRHPACASISSQESQPNLAPVSLRQRLERRYSR